MKRCLGSSTVSADQGIANNFAPKPMMPPNDNTAYATRPVITSTISSSTRPMSSPAVLTTRSWVRVEAPRVLRKLYMLRLQARGHGLLQRPGGIGVGLQHRLDLLQQRDEVLVGDDADVRVDLDELALVRAVHQL